MPLPGQEEIRLFTSLVVSEPRKSQHLRVMPYSLVVHGIIIVAVVLVPVLWPEPSPEHADYVRALIYDPPPPPPPPLLKGSVLVQKPKPTPPAVPDSEPDPDKPRVTVPDESVQVGEERGSESGALDGMEDGIEGGQVGGVPGGVLGGVVGGTGDIVLDYDQPPRLIYSVKPEYPQDAFAKKIEGTVEVEFIIGPDGRVRRAWVVRSVRILDAAAVRAVSQWVFSPAIRRGVPVATTARAPVAFRIY